MPLVPHMTAVVVARQEARDELLGLLRESGVQVLGDSSEGVEGVLSARKHKPDLLLVGPSVAGLGTAGFLQAFRAARIVPEPLVIIATPPGEIGRKIANEQQVFETLQTPIDPKRFQSMLNRAHTYLLSLRNNEVEAAIGGGPVASMPERLKRLVVKSNGRFIFLETAEVLWIEAEGNYVRIHVESGSHLVRESMTAIERRLEPSMFLRVHRSSIVNLAHVRELRSAMNESDSAVVLRDGTRLALSRTYRGKIESLLSRQNPS